MITLVGELNIASAEFARWWSDRREFQRTNGVKRIVNDVVGEITLNYEAFDVVSDEQLLLIIYTAAPGSAVRTARVASQLGGNITGIGEPSAASH